MQFLPRTLMVFGALLAVLGGGFHLLDKRNNSLSHLYEKQWSFYLVIVAFVLVSLILTFVINSIWHA